ncbi:hypothetical protein LFWB_1910 [Candidatus Phytoplasma luffae]|uniref:Transmembrane protein n=1 Tax=Loofah witches'-broom phytoplasma TaxID=35773 RepID=A0A975FKS6_LOWBP|nr:hypothetical protein [Candidatus Phytoplasma luffae]QTX02761.1 hypothetical protein LFWB_1910 [Candidatus Phytoplasma luffae]
MNGIGDFITNFMKYHPWFFAFICFTIFSILFCFYGPIIKAIYKLSEFICKIFVFNFNFLFDKNKVEKSNNSEGNDSQNNPSLNNDNKNNNVLSLIEMKMMELNYKSKENNNNNETQKQNLFRLEIEQKLHKYQIENKLSLIEQEQKHSLEKQDLKQEIYFLKHQMQSHIKRNETQSLNFDNPGKESFDREKKEFESINEFFKKQIPESLKQIFEKISDVENIQLCMLDKIIDGKNDQKVNDSYYDSYKNVLYVNEKDLFFIKTLLEDKKKEQKRLN